MSNESVINVSVDENSIPLVSSPYEETAKREDVIALLTKAIAHMSALQKEAFAAGRIKPGMHFEFKDVKPYTIPFRILSDGGTSSSFDVEFTKKDFEIAALVFAEMFLKEKRKMVRRELSESKKKK
jgi:hypothetical protein